MLLTAVCCAVWAGMTEVVELVLVAPVLELVVEVATVMETAVVLKVMADVWVTFPAVMATTPVLVFTVVSSRT
jgi:hypothetical protein